MTMFNKGSPEQCLNYVQMELETIKQKGLLVANDTACKEDKEAECKLVKATDAYSSYQGTDENPPEKKTLKMANEAKTCTSKAIAPVIGQVFMLYSYLLTEEARHSWTKIVEEQIHSEPWTALYGNDHPKKHAESWASFMECITFHLQTMFRHDMAKKQRFWISNGLQKPTLCSRSSALTSTWTYCHASITLQGHQSPRQVTSSGWPLGTDRTSTSSVEPQSHKVSGNSLKPCNASKKPFRPTRIVKGPRVALNQVPLPRGR